LNIDDYLMGVVPFEIGHHGREKLEAIKAQAIAARTYTFKRMLNPASERPFDVFSDVRDQVYKGQSGEYLLVERAVRETRGIVVLCKDTLIEGYYSSTCGGKTSTVNEVWTGKPEYSYLRTIKDRDKDSAFCCASRYMNWKVEWTYSDLNRIVQKNLPLIDSGAKYCGKLKGLKVLDRTTSGRVARLGIKTAKGSFVVYGDKIRWVLRRPEKGNPILYSAWFDLKKPRLGRIGKFTAVGHGWGHGVGMCQMGALGMAARGYTYEQILKHYYSGIELVKWEY